MADAFELLAQMPRPTDEDLLTTVNPRGPVMMRDQDLTRYVPSETMDAVESAIRESRKYD